MFYVRDPEFSARELEMEHHVIKRHDIQSTCKIPEAVYAPITNIEKDIMNKLPFAIT